MNKKAFQKAGKQAGQIPQVPSGEITLDESLASGDIGYSFVLMQHLTRISQLSASVVGQGNFYNLYNAISILDDMLIHKQDSQYKTEKAELEEWAKTWKAKHIKESGELQERIKNDRLMQGYFIQRSRRLLRIIISLMNRQNLLPESQSPEVFHG